MPARLCPPLLLTLCLVSAGCGLVPLPYATDVTGPVSAIQVVDASTGADIAAAHATLESGMGMTNWEGPRPPQLMILPPDSVEGSKMLAAPGLERREDQTFAVPRHVIVGLVRGGYARQNPPTATIAVFAPEYPHAVLQYCAGNPPQPGWSDSRVLAADATQPGPLPPETAPDSQRELVRCELQSNGTLRFYLRRLTPEMAEAIRSPGRSWPTAVADRQSPVAEQVLR